MKFQVIKFRDIQKSYSIIIGNNALSLLPQKIRELCPKTKKVAIIIDRITLAYTKKQREALGLS